MKQFNIIQSMSDLPDPKNLPNILARDTETTTFRGSVNALIPESGTRACGYGYTTRDGVGWYLPVRHSSPDIGKTHFNLDLEKASKWCQDAEQGRTIIGHNVKFDHRIAKHDGIFDQAARLEDSGTAIRLANHDHMSYRLSDLIRHYFPDSEDHFKGDKVIKEYLKSTFNNKDEHDYGAVPVDLLGHYCLQDTWESFNLRDKGLELMPERAIPLWNQECELLYYLTKEEAKGFALDLIELKAVHRELLLRTVEILDEMYKIAGTEFDPDDEKELNFILTEVCGIVPVEFTPKARKPKWDKHVLRAMDHPIGPLLAEYNRIKWLIGTFCVGWSSRVDPFGRLHTQLNPSGTATGRFSSDNPNMQNVPKWAEYFVHPPEGHVLVKFDLSQIEYRMFAHFSRAKEILAAYAKDASTDYHQMFADILGVSRTIAKTLNFAMIYGMGKKTLILRLIALVREKKNAELLQQMLNKVPVPSLSERQRLKMASTKVYNEYHERFPAIRAFNAEVERRLRARNYVHNLYGRTYQWPDDKLQFAYKATNYLIQGSAADYMKECLITILRDVIPAHDAEFITTVHDSVIATVPRENVYPFYNAMQNAMEGGKQIAVPIYAEGEVSTQSWAATVKVPRNPTYEQLDQAIIESSQLPKRPAGVL